MSDYSVMAQFRISPVALKRYLDAPARPASGWADWGEMRGRVDGTGRQDGLPFSLHGEPGEMDFESVDRWLSVGDYRSQLRAVLGLAALPALARFGYDEEAGVATAVNLTVAGECFRNPLWVLATLRGAADHVDGVGGVAVVRNHCWEGPEDRYTLAVLRLDPGGSRFLHPADDADAYAEAVHRANRAFDAIDLPRPGEPLPSGGDAVAALDRM
ncbi:hypothetical protein ACWCXH_12330 [Kitasatospora sp. NPDC001660]